jgi:hypothetical protein
MPMDGEKGFVIDTSIFIHTPNVVKTAPRVLFCMFSWSSPRPPNSFIISTAVINTHRYSKALPRRGLGVMVDKISPACLVSLLLPSSRQVV